MSSSSVFRPKFDVRKYATTVPEDAFPAGADEPVCNVSLDPYVPESKKPVPVELHTRANYFGTTTAEPLKPAVVYQDQETQTEPVVVVPAREAEAQEMYMCHVRNGAAELRSDKIRLERELDALRLEMEKLSIELHAARSAEERRLAHDKLRLEQLERAAEDELRLEQLERAAEDKMRQTLQQKAREPAKPAKPVKPAQAPVRTRTNNRTSGPK